ncbi:lipopolysaccharide heptosyltransferase II [Helicobacter sp. 13S00477-4]|uniref:lipopolysaccharide heptosyltransferase II n=1 Tax=Helicobacter sp. 13S00477-4 TaxID=1905759 RepID=UPI000BA6D227|nr:lipopolysaccharide heptosyltransferase II [Helicobacter sp. 13S00477-4]
MKILLRLPNWIGDAVMASATFELLKSHFPKASFTLIGPQAVCGLFQRDTAVSFCFIDETKKSKNRLLSTYKLAKKITKHDIAITFTNSIYSAILLFFTKTPLRIGYKKNFRSFFLTHPIKPQSQIHQVLSYACLLQPILKKNTDEIIAQTPTLKLIYLLPKSLNKNKIRIGINPGAAFGSAKRWLKEYFAQIISYFIQKDFEVILFGNQSDLEASKDIIKTTTQLSPQKSLKNITNLTGKTNIISLIDTISTLDLFITNDSGPMHIATAIRIPLIAMFGPTNDQETSPWKHPQAIILNKKLQCAPCKKRTCPLKHHHCMEYILPNEVIEKANQILTRKKYAN